jgi:hypothetical protein
MNQDERLNRDRVPTNPRRWDPVSSAVGLTGAGTATLGFVQTPWWAIMICTLVGIGAAALHVVFPQESADRLSWWKDRRRHAERVSARARCPCGGSAANDTSATANCSGHMYRLPSR